MLLVGGTEAEEKIVKSKVLCSQRFKALEYKIFLRNYLHTDFHEWLI